MRATLRVLGAVDVVSGAAMLAAASWFGDQLDLGTNVVRVIAAVTILLGIETLLMQKRPAMGRVAMVIEALVAFTAIDLAILREPTGTGTAMLAVTAVYGVVAAITLFTQQRSPALVAA
jgi:hypothetical protein